MFTIEFSYNFLYVWNCTELYEKKFPIYENCMISIFGQPGLFELNVWISWISGNCFNLTLVDTFFNLKTFMLVELYASRYTAKFIFDEAYI